ncbi:hypothetical protein [Actinomadura luteofluorescens]|uniref:hypothetical protein n=1 Tax=Actinomadura luteofluorescens TaxID=46163 RepID=UPI003D919BF1
MPTAAPVPPLPPVPRIPAPVSRSEGRRPRRPRPRVRATAAGARVRAGTGGFEPHYALPDGLRDAVPARLWRRDDALRPFDFFRLVRAIVTG